MIDTVVLVLNWNGWRDTRRLVSSLLQSAVAAPIWVADNGSTRDESQSIRDLDPRITVVRFAENYGFAGGMNRALRLVAAHGYAMAYAINNDCFVNGDFLTPIVEGARSLRKIAILGSRYLSRDDRGEYTRWGFHSDPSEEETFSDGVLLTDRVVGCGMLVKIDAFVEVGAFDERFFCYGEENDLCRRLAKRGYEVGVCYDSLIFHDHKGSDVSGNAAYYQTRNLYLLNRLHPEHRDYRPDPLGILADAWARLRNCDYTLCSSYVEGMHEGLLGIYGKRQKAYSKVVVIGLLLLYSCFYLPLRSVRLATQVRRSLRPAR